MVLVARSGSNVAALSRRESLLFGRNQPNSALGSLLTELDRRVRNSLPKSMACPVSSRKTTDVSAYKGFPNANSSKIYWTNLPERLIIRSAHHILALDTARAGGLAPARRRRDAHARLMPAAP